MLQKLRDQTQSAGFKVIVAVLVFALAFFGFGAFNIFAPGDPTAASVNGEDITQGTLLTEADRQRRRLLAQYGDQLNPEDLDPLTVQSIALEGLINRTLLSQIVADLDLKASPTRVEAAVRADSNFQVDGAFDQNLYRRGLSALGYTPTGYMAELAARMNGDQLRQAVADSAFNVDWQAKQVVGLMDQRRDLAWLAFTLNDFSENVAVEATDIELYYAEHQAEMMTDESVDVIYVELAWDQLLEDPSIAIGIEDLQREYEAGKAAAGDSEKRRSAHILLRTGDERSEEAALSELEDLRRRLLAGESFAELAEAHSEDPGSAALGGDLGAVGRGVFDPAFEEALWALQEEGELSPPVKSAFGYHLIRLDGVEFTEYPGFEEQKDEIEQRLRREAAKELFADRVRELDNLAFEQNDSLEGIAEALGLRLQQVDNITSDGGPGIFAEDELRDAVFASDVLNDGNNTAAVEYGDSRAVVARVRTHHPQQQRTLEDARPQIEALLVERAARQALTEASVDAKARIQAGESVAEVADSYGLAWRTIEGARRLTEDEAPAAVLQAAFDLPRPEAGGKSIGTASLVEEGEAIVTVTRVQDGEPAALADTELDGLHQLALVRGQRLDFDALFQDYRAAADISRRVAERE